MVSKAEAYVWVVVASVLVVFSVPWFLWGNSTIVSGLPVWLWWHIFWMLLTSVVLHFFGRRAWGIGIGVEFGDGVSEEGEE